MDAKQSPAIAAIRQACLAGLPGRALMPVVAAQLRRLVPAACCQFTWSSDTGRLVNFWSDTFMPRRTAWIILHHRRYEADAGMSFRDLVMFGRPTGNLRAWWTQGFERTETYAAVFAPYGLKWFLDGIVRDESRPYGCLALIRRRDEPDFSAREEAIVERVLPYLAHALRREAAQPSRFVPAGRSAMIVCDGDGRVLEWSELAHRLAVYALVEQINLDAQVERDDFGQMQQALREIARDIAARLLAGDELPMEVRRNGWGEFVFRGYRLQGADGAAARLGLLVEQLVPLQAHLLGRVNALPLSARQKEVALLSVQGLGNAEIASRLHVSPNTLKDYFKAIYQRLGINSQRQLAEQLAGSN